MNNAKRLLLLDISMYAGGPTKTYKQEIHIYNKVGTWIGVARSSTKQVRLDILYNGTIVTKL